MANAKGKSIDNTHLSIDASIERGVMHRDHDAHVYRWTHVAKMLRQGGRYKTTRILDVGCGIDVPLAKLLHSNRLLVESYVGVDYNAKSKFIDRNWGSMNVTLYGGTIFPRDLKLKGAGSYEVKGGPLHKLPNLITMFEVIEHIEPVHFISVMKAIYRLATLGGAEVVISTPCWDVVHCADNHVSEMKHAALGATLENLGFEITHNFGTFASISEYKDALFAKYGPGVEKFFNDQREYYDSNILSNMFCAGFPSLSRNSLWRLVPAKEGYVRKFPMLDEIPTPWTSSEQWADMKLSEAQ